jgi:HD-GYP domain-containing protein (c-di-GMP phosphodiesterase class II)
MKLAKKALKKAAKKKKPANKNIKIGKIGILEVFEDENAPASAAEQYRLKVEKLEKEVLILREIAEVTNKDFSLDKILERFLELLMDTICADAGSLLLVDKASDTLTFTAALGKKAGKLKDYKLKMGEGIAGWVAQSGKAIITPDVKKDIRFSPTISRAIKYATRNILCVPLKFEHDILGVVELLNKHGNGAFDENDLAIVSAYVPYVSMIIKNAQLFIENKNRIHRLEHLMQLTEYVNSTLNIDTLFDMILGISMDTLGAEAGSIMMLDEEKQTLKFAAVSGPKSGKLKEVKVPVGEGIAGWVIRENRGVLITDAQSDPRFFKEADQKTDFKTKSVLAVPLRTKNNLIGVVEVLNKKNNESFNSDDMLMLEALSNQAAIAIENARLYANVKELFVNTVRSLATAIETKDVYTRGHSERVTMFSGLMAKALSFSEEETENLNLTGILHDIGKIGVDESILRKPSKLTEAEYTEIMKHPEYAANILEAIPQLRHIIPAVKHHHERYDGNGYPSKLKGEKIPYFSRILAIADTFDAMSSSRPYRQALPFNVCIEEIKRCAGTQFDPELAEVAVKAFKLWHGLKMKNTKEK